MTEIFRNTSESVLIDVYNADVNGTPTATLIRTDGSSLALAVSLVTPPSAPNAVTYKAYVPLAETASEGEVQVTWGINAGGEDTVVVRNYTISTPYATPYEIAARLGWQFDDPQSAGYQDYDRLIAAELIARNIIDRDAEQKFGYITKTVTGWGKNTDVLTLPERIINVKKIYQDDELIYDATVDPTYNVWGYDIVVSETDRAIRLKSAGINFSESETVSLVYGAGYFREGSRYAVYGDYGFNSVPDAIVEATILIVNDLMCQDSVYRTRYISNVQVKDWKFTYNTMTWLGTGNALADTLISSQKIQPVWVI